MISTRKRGEHFHVDYVSGPVRLRGPLGTSDPKSAKRLANRIGYAMSDGPRSEVWHELRPVLPDGTWSRFSGHAGVSMAPTRTWGDLLSIFWKESSKSWAKSTARGYDRILCQFEKFLPNAASTPLSVITKAVIEKYRAGREKSTLSTPQFRNGAALEKEMKLLRQAFAFAKEEGMIEVNPVRLDKSIAVRQITQPFSDEEMARLTEVTLNSREDFVIFTTLRWTGLRGSDVSDLRWRDVHFLDGEIRRATIKLGVEVIIPVNKELMSALQAQYDDRTGGDSNWRVFNSIPDRGALYRKVQTWGKKAKIENCRPHRFRDTLAVTILLRGGTMHDVAKILGNTVAVAEKYYSPFVPELRSRLRRLLDQEST